MLLVLLCHNLGVALAAGHFDAALAVHLALLNSFTTSGAYLHQLINRAW